MFVLSDPSCKQDALLVGDSLPDYRRRNPEDLDENCYGSWDSVRVVNRKETVIELKYLSFRCRMMYGFAELPHTVVGVCGEFQWTGRFLQRGI